MSKRILELFNTFLFYFVHKRLIANCDSKSIFIEVLHMYIYDPVTIVRVSTPLHCCNII